MSAAETYAARVDAVLEQQTRVRGPQPPGDLFAGLPPARNGELFRLVQGEPSESVPGHVELVNVLWELGIEPDVRMLPDLWGSPTSPTREAAVQAAMMSVRGHQWAFWPLTPEVQA